jgi:hypothetical protein
MSNRPQLTKLLNMGFRIAGAAHRRGAAG